MNRNKVAFAGALVLVATVSNIHGRVRQHQKQAKIINDIADELLIVFKAYTRVSTDAANGKYRNKDFSSVKEDLEFQIIALHNE